MKGMANMMKQAQKLQAQMAKMQEDLAHRTVEAAAGGGMVKVTVNAAQPPQVVGIEIDPEAVDPEDVQMLADMVQAAVNSGLRESHELLSAEMGRLTGGLSIPGLT